MTNLINFRNNLSLSIIIFYPILFILGPALLNIFTLLFVLLNFDRITFPLKQKREKFIFISFFIFILYCLVVSLTAYDVVSSIRRSISFLIHGFFFLILWSYSDLEINHKKFIKILLISILFVNSFVLIDTTIQFVVGKDLFNYEAHRYRLSGPFNDELVVGSYLYKFSIISFASLLTLINKPKFYVTFYLIISLLIITLSGERASMILFLFSLLFLILIFKLGSLKKYLKYFFLLVLMVSVVITIVFKSENVKIFKINDASYIDGKRNEILLKEKNNNISNFNYRIFWIFDRIIIQTTNDILNFKNSSYFALFKSASFTWQNNKLIGVGLKNFRISCQKTNLNIKDNNYPTCSTHPHNYILEILSELGLIGLILFCIFSLSVSRKIYIFNKNKSEYNYLSKSLIVVLLAIMFPFLPTGSFFSTFNSSFFWYFLSILFYLIGLNDKKI